MGKYTLRHELNKLIAYKVLHYVCVFTILWILNVRFLHFTDSTTFYSFFDRHNAQQKKNKFPIKLVFNTALNSCFLTATCWHRFISSHPKVHDEVISSCEIKPCSSISIIWTGQTKKTTSRGNEGLVRINFCTGERMLKGVKGRIPSSSH